MLDQLKNLNVDRPQLDELIALQAEAASLKGAYEKFGIEEPEWLSNADRNLHREIRNRAAADIERKIREKKGQLEGLKTTAEKRAALEADLAALNAKAGA